jgi:hypothetical protein
METEKECDRQRGGPQYGEENSRIDTGIAIRKITNRIKVFKYCLLNACKREYGI